MRDVQSLLVLAVFIDCERSTRNFWPRPKKVPVSATFNCQEFVGSTSFPRGRFVVRISKRVTAIRFFSCPI